jgi:predicted DNA-binding transcriptional regulator YafY
VSRRKLERLLNLTMCLMATSRFLSVAEIGTLVDGYAPGDTAESEAAFRRMFERDKDDLRELGIPLETGSNSPWDDEPGYRIRRSDYALPEISLDPDEAAALGLAARLWSSASLADATASALRKLAAGGADTRPAPDGLAPRVDATEPAFEPCLAAVREGRAVRFPYRRPADRESVERHVEPWGVVSWRGRWYLAGKDRDRGAERVFRLSRVTGPVRAVGPRGAVSVPPDLDLRSMIAASEPAVRTTTARLRVRKDTAHALRRAARDTRADGPDHDLVEIGFTDLDRLARWVVGHGPDVVVLSPPELREVVVGRLRAAYAAHHGGVSGVRAGGRGE